MEKNRKHSISAIYFLCIMIWGGMFISPGNFFPYGRFLSPGSVFAQENEVESQVPLDDDQASPTAEIRKELDGLEEKRLKIQKEEQRLNEQRRYLESLKEEIEEKIEALKQVQKQIQDAVAEKKKLETEEERRAKAEEEAQLRQLVKVYTGMKPKAAAELINRLDLEVALKLFERMKGDTAGRILTYVNKDLGAQISEGLTRNKFNRE